MTHDITLPYQQIPRFPHRCVVCETPDPDAIAQVKVVIAIQRQGLAGDLVDTIIDAPNAGSRNVTITLKPAVHQRCKGSLMQYHFWKQIWQYLGPFLGVALFVLCIIKNLTFLSVVALIAGIILPIVYELVFPGAVSATGSGGNVIYEFRSALCAQEFAQLNQNNDQPNPLNQ
jgi:hypothetical protein